MRSPFIYLKNVLWVGLKKIRFGGHFSAGIIQSFDKAKVEIYKGGSIRLGSYNQNRGNLYLVADGGSIKIGDHCFFNTGASVSSVEQVKIGNGCKFGNNLVIVDHDHNFKNEGEEEFIHSKVEIGDNVWVGANVTILRGTKIGSNAVIGAGCVIKGIVAEGEKVIQERVKK